MSKQHPKDAAHPVDIHTLMVCDSGLDPYVGRSQQLSSKPILFERDIQTYRALTQEERLTLLQLVNRKLAPGLTSTMIAAHDGTRFKFLISEQ
jgi:hypothetical protein